ncbi:MAG: aminotransferase class I/II-fold pyridoxal phosphate-dependent enzyme [Chloroflexota bacterium]
MKKNFQVFELERFMGKWEHEVKYNLSESGVHPMTTKELLNDNPRLIEELLTTELNYPHTNGLPELRERIAALYPGASPDEVLVTTGAAQANFTTILSTLDRGEEILVMLPNYMQIWGLAKNLGLHVKTFSLEEGLDWGFDIDKFHQAVTEKTKLIAVCNPNNPTGYIMSAEERQAVVNAASRVGAWILSDEVYAGAEHNTDEVTPSMWGEYEKVFAIGSMSKAYALPGLRIGWVVSNAKMAEEIWARQDYVSICPSMLGNKLAAYALSEPVRRRLLDRTREYVRNGYRIVDQWVKEHDEILSVVPPQAAAITFVHYKKDINSSQFVERLIHEQDTYVVPGDHFGMDYHLRISYGLADEYVKEGLRRVFTTLTS